MIQEKEEEALTDLKVITGNRKKQDNAKGFKGSQEKGNVEGPKSKGKKEKRFRSHIGYNKAEQSGGRGMTNTQTCQNKRLKEGYRLGKVYHVAE